MTSHYTSRIRAAVAIGTLAFVFHTPVEAAAPGQRVAESADYPNKPIRILDPFAAGGSTDLMARLMGQKLNERFGQPIIVDNRPGAGGNVAAEILVKAPPDGYTLLMAVVPALAPSVTLYPRLSYNVMKDFNFVTLLAAGAYVLVVHPSLPAKSVGELVKLAKSQPAQIRYGSSGVGGPLHLAGELLKSQAGIDILHVPYKGAAPVMAAVAGGEVQVGFSSLAGAQPMINAGRAVPIAVTNAKRAKAMPDLPTIAEAGFPGFDITPWYGLLAPAATPDAIVKPLSAEIGRILLLPDVQASFAGWGLEVSPSTPARFREVMRSEIDKAAQIIKKAGIKAE